MKRYTVIVKQTTEEPSERREWVAISKVGDKTEYGYAPTSSGNPERVQVQIYEQTVDELDLRTLVMVVNAAPRGGAK
jgi:hypothetical protein